MLTCNLMGGLGNQLFQIFTVLSCAINNKHDFQFINTEKLGEGSTTVRPTYWNSILSKLSTCLFNQYPEINVVFREEGFTYKNIPNHLFQENTNIMIFGYFQSYKYFHENYKLINLILDIYEKQQEVLKYCTSKKLYNTDLLDNTISLHFRLGDYKKLPMYHPIMSYEYYKKSLQHITTNITYIPNILYFCEDEDVESVNETIQKLMNDFPDVTFERASNKLDDWQQLLLMSCCNHNIIANSSFSWWGAYFNSHKNKIVCYPSKWFGLSMTNHDTCDLFPPEWSKIIEP